MRKIVLFLFITAVIPALWGCTTIGDPEPIFSMNYINTTEHTVSMAFSKYVHIAGVWKEEDSYSISIPANSTAHKEVELGQLNPAFLSCCVIMFEDGKRLRYHAELDETSGHPRVISTDPLSPVTISAYSREITEEMIIYTFRITEDHYLKAE